MAALTRRPRARIRRPRHRRFRNISPADAGDQHPQLPVREPAPQRGIESRLRRGQADRDSTPTSTSWPNGGALPKDQLYHLTDVPPPDEKRKKVEPKPDRKKKRAAKEAPDEMASKKAEFVEPAPRPKGLVPPLRNVIEGTITQFLETCRAQDRVVLVFCGHAVEKMGAAYIVPLEGDLDDVDSLIPLAWLYEKLGACKAQEKVIIWDVCRFHPERGIERPHPGPMTEALEKAPPYVA